MAVTVLKPEGTDDARGTESAPRCALETVERPLLDEIGCSGGLIPVVLGVDAAVKVEVRFVRIPNIVSECTRRLTLLEELATEHYSVFHILWRQLLASPHLVWVKP